VYPRFAALETAGIAGTRRYA